MAFYSARPNVNWPMSYEPATGQWYHVITGTRREGAPFQQIPGPTFPRPWKEPWRPPLPTPRQTDIALRILQRRATVQAQRQAEQERARERASHEAQQRMEADRARIRERQVHQAAERTKQQRARQQVDAMLEYHRSFGRKWMAERGPFGLTMGMYPIAKYGGKYVLAPYMEAGGYVTAAVVSPVAGNVGLVLSHKIKTNVKEIEHYEDSLRAQARSTDQRRVIVTPNAAKTEADMEPIGKYEVMVAGTAKKSLQDKIVSDFAGAFADRLLEQQLENPGRSMSLVSMHAHKLAQEVDLPDICRKYGIKPHQVEVEPISGVTGSGGGQTRYDAGIFRQRSALIELQASRNYRPRKAVQLQTHMIGVGEQTATYGRPGDYYRIYANERLIEKFTGEDLARALQVQRLQAIRGRLPR